MNTIHRQPCRGVLRKRCSENMKQIYRRTPIPKCDFNKAAFDYYIRGGYESIKELAMCTVFPRKCFVILIKKWHVFLVSMKLNQSEKGIPIQHLSYIFQHLD